MRFKKRDLTFIVAIAAMIAIGVVIRLALTYHDFATLEAKYGPAIRINISGQSCFITRGFSAIDFQGLGPGYYFEYPKASTPGDGITISGAMMTGYIDFAGNISATAAQGSGPFGYTTCDKGKTRTAE